MAQQKEKQNVKQLTRKDLKAMIRKVLKMQNLHNMKEGLEACLTLAELLELEGAS